MTDHLGKEMPYSHFFQFFSYFVFFIVWVLDTFSLSISTWLNDSIPAIIRIFCFGITIVIAFYLMIKAHSLVISNNNQEKKLATTGVFLVIRHPMYLGSLLICLSLVFLSISLISLVTFLIIVIIHDIMARYEEKDLVKLLGKEYEEYKSKTSRWIPYIY